jgi:drug/metabolite transporter (DMT)-like permease
MALGLLGVAVFSLTLPATRRAAFELDPWVLAFGRMALAGIVAAIGLALSRARPPDRSTWLRLALVALGVVLGFPLFSKLAMTEVDASHGGVVLAVLPLCTAVAAAVLAKERPSPAFWLWACAGAAVVLAFALLRGKGGLALADLHLALACVLAALGYAQGALLARRMPGLAVIAWALVLSLPLVLPACLALLPRVAWSASPTAWGCFAYVALGSQLLGFLFWYRGLAIGGITRVGQVQLLQPFMTLAAAALLLGERLDTATVLFAVVTVLCVWAGRRARA